MTSKAASGLPSDKTAPDTLIQDQPGEETHAKTKVVSQETDPQQQTSSSSRASTRVAATKKQQAETDTDIDEDEEVVVFSDIEKDAEGANTFTTVHWDGKPPEAKGIIAKRFAATTVEAQFRQAEELLEVTDGGKVQIGLQPTNWTPFLLAVPGSFRKVRVVYGAALLEYDTHATTEEDRVVVLHGEYIPDLAFPDVLELPTKALKASGLKCPTGKEFGTKRKQARATESPTWFVASKIKKAVQLPFLIPIPPCLVYDAIEQDIDSLIVYERWMVMREEAQGHFQTLDSTIRSFLKGLLVAPNARHAQGRLQLDLFVAGGASPSVLNWKKQQIKLLAPVAPQSTSTSPLMPTGYIQEFATAFVSAHHNHIDSNIGTVANRSRPPAPTPAVETETTAYLGLSKSTFNRLLGMCGLSPGEENHIPKLWTALSEKSLTATDKKVIVRTHVDSNVKYRDAKIKLYYPLVQMIIKRDFEEETTTSCLKSAVKGLTPFAVPNLTDDEANRINELYLALETATSTTIKDVSAASIKLDVPASSEELTKRFKRYANLLIVCFGETCPLLREVDYLIVDLEDYSDYARSGMSQRTIASTIWSVHTQSRYFARGYMNQDSGMDSTLPMFDVMSKCIMNRQPVVNGDVPPILYLPPVSNRNQDQDTSDATRGRGRGDRRRRGASLERDSNRNSSNPNRNRIIQVANYHPHIKSKMSRIVGDGRRLPRVSLLCQKAETRAHELFPGRDDLCIKATLYGTCFENCSRKHDLVTDQEAKAAMTKLQTVIDNPNLVKVNNNY